VNAKGVERMTGPSLGRTITAMVPTRCSIPGEWRPVVQQHRWASARGAKERRETQLYACPLRVNTRHSAPGTRMTKRGRFRLAKPSREAQTTQIKPLMTASMDANGLATHADAAPPFAEAGRCATPTAPRPASATVVRGGQNTTCQIKS
jgi:hypothetical protein